MTKSEIISLINKHSSPEYGFNEHNEFEEIGRIIYTEDIEKLADILTDKAVGE